MSLTSRDESSFASLIAGDLSIDSLKDCDGATLQAKPSDEQDDIDRPPLSGRARRALEVLEILRNVLDLVGHNDKAAMARVSKRWSSPALDSLWAHLDSVLPLLETVVPLTVMAGTWRFSSDVALADWDRFTSYANRIHFLSHTDQTGFKGSTSLISTELISQFTMFRPVDRTPAFCNLKALRWAAKNAHSFLALLPFVSPTLKRLRLEWLGSGSDVCARLLHGLAARKPSLSEFTLITKQNDTALSAALGRFLQRQTCLIKVWLPPYSASSEVIKGLSASPALEEWACSSLKEYHAPVTAGMQFQWAADMFVALRSLVLYTPLSSTFKITSETSRPRITRLVLVMGTLSDRDQLIALTKSLPKSFNNLERITLCFFSGPAGTGICIDFGAIQNLLECRGLIELQIRHNSPMPLQSRDVASMGVAWKHMKHLSLCADPVMIPPSELGSSMDLLEDFATHLPNLESLGTYVRGTAGPPVFSATTQRAFAQLKVLDFGTSPIPTKKDKRFAIFLSRICPPETTIFGKRSFPHWINVPMGKGLAKKYAEREAYWDDVYATVKMIQAEIQSALAEKEQLGREVEALKTRFGVTAASPFPKIPITSSGPPIPSEMLPDMAAKYAHTQAYITHLAEEYPSAAGTLDAGNDDGNEQERSAKAKPELVKKVVRLLDDEDEDGLKELVKHTYGVESSDSNALEQIVLDLMHKHKDDLQGVPFVFLSSPLKRPISRPSSRASTHSFRVHSTSSPAGPPNPPGSPLAKSLSLRRPHTPLASPLSAGLSAPPGFPIGSANFGSPVSSPTNTMSNPFPFAVASSQPHHLASQSSQPSSPLNSPHFLNAKAVEFRPTMTQRPSSAMSGSFSGPAGGGGRTDTPSPDLWAHRPFDNYNIAAPNSPRRASGSLAIASPLTSETSPYYGGFRPSSSLARSNSGLRQSTPSTEMIDADKSDDQPKKHSLFNRVDDDEVNDEFSPFQPSTAAVPAITMSKSTASTHGPNFDDVVTSHGYPANASQTNLNDDDESFALSQHQDPYYSNGSADQTGMGTDGMTPFEVLHSIFGASVPPATLEEALNKNGYEFEAAMAWLIDSGGKAVPPGSPQPSTALRPMMLPVTGSGGRVVTASRDAVNLMRGGAPAGMMGRGGASAAGNWMGQRPAVATGGRVCRYFLAGECRRADCRFSHDVERALCRFWLKGQCVKGEQCEFLHTLPQDIDVQGLTSAMASADMPGSRSGSRQDYESPPPDDFPSLHAAAARANGGAISPHRNPDPGRTRFASAVKKQPAVVVTPQPGSATAPQRVSTSFGVRRLPGDRSSPATPRPSPRIKLRPPSLLPTLPTGEVVNKLYMTYRNRAIQLGGARNQALTRAAEAWKRGDGAAAKKYSRDAHELNGKMRDEMVEAAQNLIRERAKVTLGAVRGRDLSWSDDPMDRTEKGKVCGGGLGIVLGVARESIGGVSGKGMKLVGEERVETLLDLHGLHSSEGVEALEEFLLNLERENFLGLAYVVVGQEKHTGTQDPNRPSSRDRLAAGVKEWLHRWQYPWNERDGVVCVDALTHTAQ
ncbi:hypothetical protein FRB96_007433 [Tulasnella sp. 330]|nr:hypothetical protein FRB96_007433 [Tulasnella sp. 330]